MKPFATLVLLFMVPSSAFAQDFHKGGFFDSDVSQTGFFTDDQAGIPIKNNTGVITTRPKVDSWEVQPEKLAGIVTAEAKVASEDQQQTNNADSFEVKKDPTD